MPLIAATNIKKNYGVDIVLAGVSISIEPGERVGLVGRNGQGKSTLLKILGGIMPADSGEISLLRGRRAGYLQQDPRFTPGESLRDAAEGAFAELHRVHAELHKVFDAMAAAGDDAATLDRLMDRQAKLEREAESLGGYAIDHKIDAMLHGVGLTDKEFGVPVEGLSGGQKGRLALARLLLEEPDLLLLDEPTNHLDITGRMWLEEFLTRDFRGAVVMVSHDRRLLDNVVNRIVEVEQGRLIDYPGGYEAFVEIRAQRRLTQARAHDKQQSNFRKQEAFIQRYKAGQRAKQAKGREMRLEREKEERTLERPMELASFQIELPKAPRSGDMVVMTNGLSKGYTNEDGARRTLFHDLDLKIARGERWGIIGPNGAGKTTLVRTLLGEIAPDEGASRMGSNVIPGYYRQTHEGIDPEATVWRQLQRIILKENPGGALSEQAARNLAGAFLFSGDEQEKTLGVLSGGERARVVLAGLLASAKNLLILDEPTNHLDIPSAERLEEALSTGDEDLTLILISHDRAFIDGTCDHLIVLDGQGGAEVFFGNYTAWREREQSRQKDAAAEESRRKEERERVEKQKRAVEEERKKAQRAAAPAAPAAKLSPMQAALARMTMEQLEEKIAGAEQRMKAIDAELMDPEVWRDQARSQKLGDERARLAAEMEPLEFEWSRRAEQM